MNEKLRQAALEIVADAILRCARTDAADADGWVIICRDEAYGRYTVSGPYQTPEQALVEASRQHQQVNAGLPADEAGWTHTVVPLFPPARLASAADG